MKSNIKRLTVILTVVFVGLVEVANAFYDPGLQRWINRDPLYTLSDVNLSDIGDFIGGLLLGIIGGISGAGSIVR